MIANSSVLMLTPTMFAVGTRAEPVDGKNWIDLAGGDALEMNNYKG
jgi:hypothetical protein